MDPTPPLAWVACRLDGAAHPFLAARLAEPLAERLRPRAGFPAPDYEIDHPDLPLLGAMLRRYGQSERPRDPVFAEALVTAILSAVAEAEGGAPHRPPAGPRLSERDAAAVKAFIEARLGRRLPLAELARFAGLSPDAFARRFKGAFGVTPHQFVLARRLARARAMLLETDESLAEIAYACGFSSQAHLTSAFTAHAGAPPGAYRRQVKR